MGAEPGVPLSCRVLWAVGYILARAKFSHRTPFLHIQFSIRGPQARLSGYNIGTSRHVRPCFEV